MLNGSPAGKFCSKRGIRQDCSLSPYLFVLVMEFWSIIMDITLASGTIKPFRRNKHLVVSHLLFADDMLVFCKGDSKSALGICDSLCKLEQLTGLSINKQRSIVFLARGVTIRKPLLSSWVFLYGFTYEISRSPFNLHLSQG